MLLAVAPDTTVPTWNSEILAACMRDLIDGVVLRQGILVLFGG
jgi:hypothetical protein